MYCISLFMVHIFVDIMLSLGMMLAIGSNVSPT